MNKNTFSNRVTWYNFILCIFVVWIHAQNVDLFTEVVMIDGKPLFNQIEQTIVSDIAVVGVAGFFLCSGYLFYRNYSWGKVLEKYKTRFVGLLIPYVIWTLLYYFIHVGVSYITPLRAVFNEPPITVTWKGIVDAVLNYRYCLAVLAYYFFKHSPSMFTNLMYLLLFASALWCLICKLPLPMAASWQKHTFMVYMTHFLIARGMNVLVSKYLSASMWPGILLFFLLPALCFALTSLFWRICGKGQSFVWKMLSGNR